MAVATPFPLRRIATGDYVTRDKAGLIWRFSRYRSLGGPDRWSAAYAIPTRRLGPTEMLPPFWGVKRFVWTYHDVGYSTRDAAVLAVFTRD